MGKGRAERKAKAGRPPTVADPRKVSVYLPDGILHEIHAEAARQERSLSWLVQKAWRMSREEIKKLAV